MNRRPLRRAGLVAVLGVALAACAIQPPRRALPELSAQQREAAESVQTARERQLRELESWSLSGRIALAKGRSGGSGRIEWVQKDPRNYEVTLDAPVSRQSWRLTGNSHYEAGRLEGLEGGVREGDDAEALLLEATGWDIPVNQLPAWLRGVISRDDGAPARIAYGTDGRLLSIEQFGWTIEYQEWSAPDGVGPELPRRIVARSGDATVRLIVDQWHLAAP